MFRRISVCCLRMHGYNASSFVPGGYNIPGYDSPGQTSPKPAAGEGRKGAGVSSITPVNIGQILNAVQEHADDAFRIDGRPVSTILSFKEGATSITYTIADETGQIDVQLWIDLHDPNEYNNTKRAEWKQGATVKVYGQIKSFQGVRSINPMRIHIVDNPHEVEYHKLEVKYIHLLNTRAAAPLAMASFPGLTPIQQKVFQFFEPPPAEPGRTVQEIYACLRNQGISEKAVREAIRKLNEEGLIFSTDNDEHWMKA